MPSDCWFTAVIALYDPPAPDTPRPASPSAVHRAFYSNVQQLELDISTIAPIHGRVVPWSDFVKDVGKTD
ncbi:MAG: hypothetical protein L0387_06035 [Acidobacteria bacterium]|nr:hypothetical protein [Acidobacteriota bacterium]MCI0723802.1 hypothetical protein [Acidobacteriota bacterium]